MSARGCREEINNEIIITETECAPDGINNVGRLDGGVIDSKLCNVEHELLTIL